MNKIRISTRYEDYNLDNLTLIESKRRRKEDIDKDELELSDDDSQFFFANISSLSLLRAKKATKKTARTLFKDKRATR